MKRTILTLCVFFALLTAANAGEMYKCVDRDGNTMISNYPRNGMKCVLKESYTDPSPQERAGEQEQRESQRIRTRQEYQREAQRINEAEQKLALQAERARRAPCEIVSFSQYEKDSGGGIATARHVIPGSGGIVTGGVIIGRTHSCVDLTIRNNDSVERTITGAGVIAETKKGKSRSPEGFMTKIQPGGMYQGTACFFGYVPTITKLECKF
jgi:hypothetical protein